MPQAKGIKINCNARDYITVSMPNYYWLKNSFFFHISLVNQYLNCWKTKDII
jgi:hypothetical protein